MRFRLHTLLIVGLLGPVVLAGLIQPAIYLVEEARWSQSLRKGIDPVTGKPLPRY
jgi:hypothetical protein